MASTSKPDQGHASTSQAYGDEEAAHSEAAPLLRAAPQRTASPPFIRRYRSRLLTLVAVVLAIVVLLVLSLAMSDRAVEAAIPERRFSYVPGFFRQGSAAQLDPTFDVWDPEARFGLVDKSWSRFRERVDKLQQSAPQGEDVQESRYGTLAWDCKWSLLESDGNLTWGPDPSLTDVGVRQAQRAHDAWGLQLQNGAPSPSVMLSSPLTRAASTAQITWSNLTGVRPMIREQLRETIGLHTCDRRRTRGYLSNTFPTFDIEPGVAENDELWTAAYQEPRSSIVVRVQAVLEQLFATERDATYVSLTAHGGIIDALKTILHHPDVEISPGGMLPLVIRGVRGPRPVVQPQPSGTAPPCT